MQTELAGIAFLFLAAIGLGIALGPYIGKVLTGVPTWLDPILQPLDRLIFRWSGIDPQREMRWQEHLAALLWINALWFVLSMLVLTNMGWLPLNPDGNPSMSAHLAFNTSVSFVTNTNLQHYSGESGMSYLGQLVLMLWQFISAGTGIAICGVLFMAMRERTADTLGNFYALFVRSCTRILLPVALVTATIFLFNGMPMTMDGKVSTTTLEGKEQLVSQGPVAAFVAIKHLGTNGGGFFGANSAHPFENPNYITNAVEMIVQMLLPIALIFALGFVVRRRRLSWMIFGVMTVGFLLLVLPVIKMETGPSPSLLSMGIDQSAGNMEGKEVRFGAAASAYWSIATTVISTGSVNAMHDSFQPLSGMNQLLAMMVNAFYGGVGVGLLNFYIFIILAVFISGLMVGRTPEFLGKKVEAKEMKIAMIVALLHPLLLLAGTALAAHNFREGSYHDFSRMLYEFTSSSANNGSGMEGLADNTPFWNISCGIVMLLARYLPIIGPIAIAGILAGKKYIPESNGTLKTDTAIFGLMVFAVMAIIVALSFFPALTLGPIAEYFSQF